MRVLGISAFYHDSAAALCVDGQILAAAQEERFSRRKNDPAFPSSAILYCLNETGLKPAQLDRVVFYEKPFLKFERLLETYLTFAPKGFRSFCTSMPLWLREKIFQKRVLIEGLEDINPDVDWAQKLRFVSHHESHAASAFLPSPFKEAAILTLDGVGEWTTTAIALGTPTDIRPLRELRFPHSLGLLYSAFTSYLGFEVNSGEYKVMGLAPYGKPRFVQTIYDHIIDVRNDGSFRLNMDYFDFCTGLKMTSASFHSLFGAPPRIPEAGALDAFHFDLAASIQEVTSEVVLRMARSAAALTQSANLCMAGGVALNCVANRRVAESGVFRRVWVQPAAGDAGGSLGAALVTEFRERPETFLIEKDPAFDGMHGAMLGPGFRTEDVVAEMDSATDYEILSEPELIGRVVDDLIAGRAVGWFQGRMEFGPRALGCRSILADARNPEMQKRLNLKIKFRESFRPFAPAVLAEYARDYFDLQDSSPYMMFTAPVQMSRRTPAFDAPDRPPMERLSVARSSIPAVTHLDYSARVQTVHKELTPRFHALLMEFFRRTGCPLLINTSFNVRDEPIVCTPRDAIKCWRATDLDSLAIESLYATKRPDRRGARERSASASLSTHSAAKLSG